MNTHIQEKIMMIKNIHDAYIQHIITCHLYRYQYQIGMTILKGLVHCKTLHLPTYYSISLVARLLMKITKLKVFQTEIRNTLQKTFE